MTIEPDQRSHDELEDERDFLLGSLRDLDLELAAGDLEESDHRALSDDYTARAAAVLRVLDSSAAPQAPADARAVPGQPAGRGGVAPGSRRGWRAAVVTVAVVAFAVGAGALMAASSGERLPGKPATGQIAATGPSDDLALARQLIGRGDTLAAIRTYDRVLAELPEQPEALAYRGWLLRLAGRASANPGLVEKGIAYIDRAIAADPAYPDARFFRGFVLYQERRDPAAAVAEFRTFLAGDPPAEYVPAAEDTLRRALADIAGASSPGPTAAAGGG